MTKKTVREIPYYDSEAKAVRGGARMEATTPRTDYDKELVARYEEEDGHPYVGPRYLARTESANRRSRLGARNQLARAMRKEVKRRHGRQPAWVLAKMAAKQQIIDDQLRQQTQVANGPEEVANGESPNNSSPCR